MQLGSAVLYSSRVPGGFLRGSWSVSDLAVYAWVFSRLSNILTPPKNVCRWIGYSKGVNESVNVCVHGGLQ